MWVINQRLLLRQKIHSVSDPYPYTAYWVLVSANWSLKMSNGQGTFDSCLEALEMDPANIKSLYCQVQRVQELKEYAFWMILGRHRR